MRKNWAKILKIGGIILVPISLWGMFAERLEKVTGMIAAIPVIGAFAAAYPYAFLGCVALLALVAGWYLDHRQSNDRKAEIETLAKEREAREAARPKPTPVFELIGSVHFPPSQQSRSYKCLFNFGCKVVDAKNVAISLYAFSHDFRRFGHGPIRTLPSSDMQAGHLMGFECEIPCGSQFPHLFFLAAVSFNDAAGEKQTKNIHKKWDHPSSGPSMLYDTPKLEAEHLEKVAFQPLNPITL